MRRGLKVLVLLAAAAAIGYGGVQTYRKAQERRALARAGEREKEIPAVAVERVATATLINTVSVTGGIEAVASVDVIPKVVGRLERLRLPGGELLERGATVNKDEVIAVIEHDALEASVKAAEAALIRAKTQAKPEVIEGLIRATRAAAAAAKAQLGDLEKTLGNLAKENDRAVSLFRQGIISAQERDRAVTTYEGTLEKVNAGRAEVDRAETAVVLAEAQTRDMAEAAVAQAEAALQLAKVALGDATIEAPIGGVVSMKFVDEGDMVGPTTPLVRIEDMDVVKVVGGVSERHVQALVEGSTSASVSVDAYPGERFEGMVYRAGPGVEPLTRTIEVEIRIPNPERKLKPGMFARLALVLQRRENVPVVSDAAILRAGEETFVYVANNSKAHRRVLKLGLAEGTRHEALDGVSPGDLVIVKGQHMLKDGDPVRVVEEANQ